MHTLGNDLAKSKMIILSSFFVILVIVSMPSAYSESAEVPLWVKEFVVLWSENLILDKGFNQIMENFIENDVISDSVINNTASHQIPNEDLEFQINEIFYYRMFQLYDYKSDTDWKIWFKISANMYLNYRNNSDLHVPAYIDNSKTHEFYKVGLESWRDVKVVADKLRVISGNDDELFANLVMQITHQFKYDDTLYTKLPLEMLVEGSGDCDTLTVFAAAVMRAGGVDATIVDALIPSNSESKTLDKGHTLLAVAIEADDFDNLWSIQDDKGVKWFLTETTSKNEYLILEPKEYSDNGYGYVGHNPWGDNIKLRTWILLPSDN